MDSGAHGIIVPNVKSRAEAERAVDAVYYPPAGSRSVGLARAQKYGGGLKEYCEWLRDSAVVIVQIEDVAAVENLDSILSVTGVDGFFVGPYDLSASLGHPGEFDHPSVLSALDEIDEAAQNGKKSGGFHVVRGGQQALDEKINRGYRFLAFGTDMVFMADTINEAAKTVHACNSTVK